MPYIHKTRRAILTPVCPNAETTGELNYQITYLAVRYLGIAPRYDDFNAVIGALESAKLEFYRRKMAAYEDKKIEENGDVY